MRIDYRICSFYVVVLLAACSETTNLSEYTQGQGGSLSRFAIQGNYLYIATATSLATYSIDENNFRKIHEIPIDFGLETITAKEEYLYMGSRDAMYIYSLKDPDKPAFVFRYSHITSCDPVVVQGKRAYVTLKSGSMCNLGSNALEIIDITDPYNPVLITNYPMSSPGGLGIYGDCLFVCEAEHGLKWLNVKDDEVRVVNTINDVNAYDVIVQNDRLTLTGEDGIFQFSYSCGSEVIKQVSKIPVERTDL